MWTDEHTHSYVSVTADFIHDDWHFKSHLLGCAPLSERRTGAALFTCQLDIARKFGIERKVNSVCIDNSSSARTQVSLSALEEVLVYDSFIDVNEYDVEDDAMRCLNSECLNDVENLFVDDTSWGRDAEAVSNEDILPCIASDTQIFPDDLALPVRSQVHTK